MTDSPPPLLRPQPRRPFELSSRHPSAANDGPATPERDVDERRDAHGNLTNGVKSESFAASRSKSLLNLTSSTLFGIYSPTQNYDTGSAYPSEPATPWGTGAETPARRSIDDGRPAWPEVRAAREQEEERRRRPNVLASIGRTIVLSVLGVGYGALVSHLHDNQHIAPVYIDTIDRSSWVYATFWGITGVALGSLLPYLDSWWRAQTSSQSRRDDNTADWTIAVRSIGAFVGIAFAIRKLPWQSTLQVSLTLALANPALWYLLDRTKPGLLLSALVGTIGTLSLLLVNPSIVPSPAAAYNGTMPLDVAEQQLHRVGLKQGQATWADGRNVDDTLLGGLLSYESIGVATWLGSVLFCSCICFGNVGRKMGI